MTKFQIEQVQAILDLAEARLRNAPFDVAAELLATHDATAANVQHDLREIARLARNTLGVAAAEPPVGGWCEGCE